MPLLGLARESAADDNVSSADRVAAIAPFVSGDTFVVGYVDLGRVESLDGGQLARRLPSLGAMPPTAEVAIRGIMNAAKGLHSAGVEGICVVMGLGDIYVGGGPLIVVAVAPGNDQQRVENMLQGGAEAFQVAFAGPLRNPKLRVKQYSADAFLVGQQRTLDRYSTAAASARPDLLQPLQTLIEQGAGLAIVDSSGPDCRRVLRELWPELPPPFASLRGELADRWLGFQFAAKFDGEPSAELALQASDKEAAELFVEMLRVLPEASQLLPEKSPHRQAMQQTLRTIVDTVPIRIEDTRAVMTLPADEAQIAKLRGLVSDVGEVALESTWRKRRMNQFKQLAFAMHSYEDVNKHFPAAVPFRADDGRPLLSWRVALLPFLEEGDSGNLYAQFHLDEPWDSPHNVTLIDKMPDVYADPNPKIRRLVGSGKTTYVVPVGPGTVFDGPEGTAYKEITDGTSKTMMVVEVPPERAVTWTKPDDWEVDLANPRRGIERTDGDKFVFASCDGAVHVLPKDVKPGVLRALITRDGKEAVDWP
jgi:hypothetical protein